MTSDNVDLVRRAIAVFNSGSLEALAESGDFYDPDVEFHEDPRLLEAEVHRGRAEVEGYFRRWLESFEDYRFEIEAIVEAGDNVVVFNHQSGRGRGS